MRGCAIQGADRYACKSSKTSFICSVICCAMFHSSPGSICWDLLFNLVKHRSTTKLLLGDDNATNNQFEETNFPKESEASAPGKEVLCLLEELDVSNLDYFAGESAALIYAVAQFVYGGVHWRHRTDPRLLSALLQA